MQTYPSAAQQTGLRTEAGNKVLRNTYMLLSMTLLFSAAMAWVAAAANWPYPGVMITLIGYFGLLFLTTKLRNSVWGIASIFALTGFMGVTMGPIVNAYVNSFSNGNELVMMALGGTGIVFFSMSGVALVSKRDFSWMGKGLMIGILVAFVAGLGAYFFQMPALSLAVSSMFILLMAGLILYQTQQIIQGGETNYIMATITLFVSLYNLFTSMLHLLGVFGGED
ncbi:MAG: Bax inhibitor-1/YccA family protein [Gammaproteobacteria bacterium]|nr:Bax inhibitor-1/YccA family protein [Gammaproteobacteria bacterium]